MRFEKSENLLNLALAMQGTREGVSLADIQGRFSVSRRTAERMRDAVERIFPQMEQANPGERQKRWRIPPGVVNSLVGFTAEELAELQNAIALLRRENLTQQAKILEGFATKIGAIARPDAMRRVAPDYEALLEAEGLAMRPGPRPRIREGVLENLREAVLACVKVRLHYHGRETGKLSRQIVCPYGFLYGNRHYLVGYSMGMRDYRLYSLSDIHRVEVTEWPFERRDDFSLRQYAERSFGVFQEQPFDVAWKFSPAAAPDAKEFLFHPGQTMEEQPDGSLLVKFHAGGMWEMCWHLFTWGSEVEVLTPKTLSRRVSEVQKVLRKLDDT